MRPNLNSTLVKPHGSIFYRSFVPDIRAIVNEPPVQEQHTVVGQSFPLTVPRRVGQRRIQRPGHKCEVSNRMDHTVALQSVIVAI